MRNMHDERRCMAHAELGADCTGCDRGSWIDAMSVVHNGSQRVHAVSDVGVRVHSTRPLQQQPTREFPGALAFGENAKEDGTTQLNAPSKELVASFASLDSALVRVGGDELTPLPMPPTAPNTVRLCQFRN